MIKYNKSDEVDADCLLECVSLFRLCLMLMKWF